MEGRPEIKSPSGLKSYAFYFFEARNYTFLIERCPKVPSFEKKLRFDLLDHQVDTLSFILGTKF